MNTLAFQFQAEKLSELNELFKEVDEKRKVSFHQVMWTKHTSCSLRCVLAQVTPYLFRIQHKCQLLSCTPMAV